MTIKTVLLVAFLLAAFANASVAECHIQLSGLSYPPLAAQARIQGAVLVHALVMSGRLSSKLSATGHPLLTAAAVRTLEATQWTNCEDGEHELRIDFELTDPCTPRPLAIEQAGPGSFRAVMSQPNPCVFGMTQYVVWRFLFWKKKVVRCEEYCPPCSEAAGEGTPSNRVVEQR